MKIDIVREHEINKEEKNKGEISVRRYLAAVQRMETKCDNIPRFLIAFFDGRENKHLVEILRLNSFGIWY